MKYYNKKFFNLLKIEDIPDENYINSNYFFDFMKNDKPLYYKNEINKISKNKVMKLLPKFVSIITKRKQIILIINDMRYSNFKNTVEEPDEIYKKYLMLMKNKYLYLKILNNILNFSIIKILNNITKSIYSQISNNKYLNYLPSSLVDLNINEYKNSMSIIRKKNTFYEYENFPNSIKKLSYNLHKIRKIPHKIIFLNINILSSNRKNLEKITLIGKENIKNLDSVSIQGNIDYFINKMKKDKLKIKTFIIEDYIYKNNDTPLLKLNEDIKHICINKYTESIYETIIFPENLDYLYINLEIINFEKKKLFKLLENVKSIGIFVLSNSKNNNFYPNDFNFNFNTKIKIFVNCIGERFNLVSPTISCIYK